MSKKCRNDVEKHFFDVEKRRKPYAKKARYIKVLHILMSFLGQKKCRNDVENRFFGVEKINKI